jgi:hypothetical protein
MLVDLAANHARTDPRAGRRRRDDGRGTLVAARLDPEHNHGAHLAGETDPPADGDPNQLGGAAS